MARLMRTSGEGLELIRSFEGFRARASRLPGGGWLIGYGHTATARAGLEITPQDAALILVHHDLPPVEQLIADRVLTPLSQNEFDALVSFVFNIGGPAFSASAVLDALNAGDRAAAADAMWAWRLANVSGELRVVDALARRRAAEIALFLEHPSGRAAIPGAVVRPLVRQGLDDEEPVSGTGTVVIAPRTDDKPAAPETPESAAQAAARAVGERIARILGEAPPQTAAPPPPPLSITDGPTPEEITDALKALVGEETIGSAARPKGPPEGIERRRATRPAEAAQPSEVNRPLPPAAGLVVDDLEVVKIDARDLQRAIKENGARGAAAPTNPGAWLPYALLSGLGLVGMIAGVDRFLARTAGPAPQDAAFYAGPLLVLGGGSLFLIAAYYLFRALTRQD